MTYAGQANFGEILYGGKASVTWRAAPAFLVSQLSDLPAPAGGVITLPAGTSWSFEALVDIGTNIISMEPGTGITGNVPGQSGILCDSANPMLSDNAADGTRTIQNLSLQNDNAAGSIFNFGNMPTSTLFMETVSFSDTDSIGIFGDIGQILINKAFVQNCGDGIRLTGATIYTLVDNFISLLPVVGFVGVRVTSTFSAQGITISNCAFNTPAGDNALDLSDLSVVGRGLVDGNQFLGDGDPLVSGANQVNPGTLSWKFEANQGIRDSGVLADLRWVDAAGGPTDIPVSGVNEWSDTAVIPFVLVESERFSQVGTNILQYEGIDPANLTITAILSAEHEGGGNDRIDITVARNIQGGGFVPALASTVDDPYEVRGEVNAGEANILTTSLNLLDVRNGDQLRINIRNKTAAVDIEAFTLCLVIKD